MTLVLDRFNEKHIPEPNSGCWLWLGGVFKFGHAAFWFEGRQQQAHRVSWQLHKGPIPEGLCVLHRCDVPCCVNPDHLFLGTQADNLRDMTEKGRGAVGEKHGRSKLTEDDVRAIRADTRSQRAIARDYGVAPSWVHCIKTRKQWRHVT